MNHSLPKLKTRTPDSHKGTFGTVLVIAGSVGMSGAAVLAGSAALRGGAGLVQVACPSAIRSEVAIGNPCFTTMPLDHESIDPSIQNATAVVIGPGLRPSISCLKILDLVFHHKKPVVVDADALNTISTLDWPSTPVSPGTILTPHPGEFSRLTGLTTQEIQKNRLGTAKAYAQKNRCVVVLKGHQTIITDGQSSHVNHTGNPGMATGGTGDVLAGLMGALLAQGYQSMETAVLATYLHGLAGDIARDQIGEISLIATDLLKYIPAAFANLRQDQLG